MLTIANIRLRYENHLALDDVSLAIEDGEILAVVGPSGSGKSSLLRVVAGLENPESGSVHLDSADVTNTPVHERNIGLMFQDYALFPHLSVSENVAFGLRMRRTQPTDLQARVAEVLQWVGLTDFASRPVESLSGGEQQRVALARCLAPTPRVMMLDEPVGALDRALRARLVPELAVLLRSIGLPTIYVTHDQDEAFAIADRIAILFNGRIVQCDLPQALWQAPVTEFVARFLGFENFADVRVRDGTAATPWGAVSTDLADGDHRIVIRPDGLSLDRTGDLVGELRASTFVAGQHHLTVSCLGHELIVHARRQPPPIGTAIRIAVRRDALSIVSTNSEQPRL